MNYKFYCFVSIILAGFHLTSAFSASSASESLKRDFFNIYKNVAIEARDVQNKPVTADQVTFYLFTRKNPDQYVVLDTNNLDAFLNCSAQLVILIHGWTNNREIEWYENLKNAFLHRDKEFFILQVDWEEPANEIYTISSINTYDVGKIIANNVIQKLHNNYQMPLENILLVGHSLGGQIAGFIGKFIQKNLGKKLPRIIALDPAGPLFTTRPDDKRLNAGDAEVVHVVHTDGGTFGFNDPCGTIDFFPNGGSSQPGCKRIDLFDIKSVGDPVICDHRRAWDLYSEAILNPQALIGTRCESWDDFENNKKCDNVTVAMGDLSHNIKGKFYLETNKDRPYTKKRGQSGGFASSILKVLKYN